MIIDAHAHLVAPESFYAYRSNLLAGGGFRHTLANVSDDALRAASDRNVAIMDAVGTDLQLISPRPYQQMHSTLPPQIVHWWMSANNDLIARTVDFHPTRFAGIAGLPLSPAEPAVACLPELRRCVEELGFVGVSLNPDPHEGKGNSPTLDNEHWYPLFEALVDYDLPALVHSAGCESGRESYSEHFITEESIAVLSLMRSRVLLDFPTLKLIIGHGGGSVPYQIGRWEAERRLPGFDNPLSEVDDTFRTSLRRLYFDTVLHEPRALELLFRVVGPDRCLFGTEKPGSGSARLPGSDRDLDDLAPVIKSINFLSAEDLHAVFENNARALFTRLKIAS